ncbi:putative ribonuclease H-like domain-containing protein [Tanacetum coccineum]
MQEELLQFKLQKVWTIVDLPKGKRAIGTKWVYRNKKDKRGIVVQNKVRLVAQGYTQEEGINCDKGFAPVARIEAIMLFLAYASFMRLIMYQMDVKSAFLYGTIEEELQLLSNYNSNLSRRDQLKFAETHNLVVFLEKPKESDGFEGIIDFLNASSIRYALTVNPTIYTSCIKHSGLTLRQKLSGGSANTSPSRMEEGIAVSKKTTKRKQRKILSSSQSGSTEPITDEAANEEHVPAHSNDPLLSGDQEDASKQGRKIANLDANAEEVEVKKVVSTAKITTVSATTTTVDELTLAQTLIEIKAAKPKAVTKQLNLRLLLLPVL